MFKYLVKTISYYLQINSLKNSVSTLFQLQLYCLDIALATIHRADFLVSWNFKHIVNIERIRGYNAINIKNGYKQLEIRSPREFEKYEDD